MHGNAGAAPGVGPAELTITITEGAPPVIVLAGEIDLATAPHFERVLSSLFSQGRNSLGVDLRGVTYLDSTGINVLMRALKTCSERGGELTIVAVSERALRVMQLLSLDRVITVRSQEDTPNQGSA